MTNDDDNPLRHLYAADNLLADIRTAPKNAATQPSSSSVKPKKTLVPVPEVNPLGNIYDNDDALLDTIRSSSPQPPPPMNRETKWRLLEEAQKDKDYCYATYSKYFQLIQPQLDTVISTLKKNDREDGRKLSFGDSVVALKKMRERIINYIDKGLGLEDEFELHDSKVDKAICDNFKDFISVLPNCGSNRWRYHQRAAATSSSTSVVKAESGVPGASSSQGKAHSRKKPRDDEGGNIASSSSVSVAAIPIGPQEPREGQVMDIADIKKKNLTVNESNFLLNMFVNASFYHVTKNTLEIQGKVRNFLKEEEKGATEEDDQNKEDRKCLTQEIVCRRLGLSRSRIAKILHPDRPKKKRRKTEDGGESDRDDGEHKQGDVVDEFDIEHVDEEELMAQLLDMSKYGT